MAGVKDFVNTVQKKFGKEVIAGDNRAGVEFLPSGSLSLDLALGGGYAKGRIIELMGYESCGKTTLAAGYEPDNDNVEVIGRFFFNPNRSLGFLCVVRQREIL